MYGIYVYFYSHTTAVIGVDLLISALVCFMVSALKASFVAFLSALLCCKQHSVTNINLCSLSPSNPLSFLSPFLSLSYISSNTTYSQTSLIRTSVIWAPPSTGQLIPYFMLTLQKLCTIQWGWPITAYAFILCSEIRTNLSYEHALIPRRPDNRGLTVPLPLPRPFSLSPLPPSHHSLPHTHTKPHTFLSSFIASLLAFLSSLLSFLGRETVPAHS